MSLWLLQTFVDIVFCYWLVVSFRSRQNIRELEERVAALDLALLERGSQSMREDFGLKDNSATDEPIAVGVEPNISKVSQTCTLSEREYVEKPNFADVYTDAAVALKRGDSLEEISKSTGISLSELRLLKKITQSSSEISAS